MQDQLRSGVASLCSTWSAFAVLEDDGSVVSRRDGGDCSKAQDHFGSGVVSFCSIPHAFAALKDDGSVASWGQSDRGRDCSKAQHQLRSGVASLRSTLYAFAQLKTFCSDAASSLGVAVIAEDIAAKCRLTAEAA